jgi:nicotinate-nucleotide adenylyltransferase
MRIGLLGGSFNPPHAAHRAVSLLALRRLALDRVWWLVSPGNPLKDTRGLPPLERRLAAARALARHPRIHVTGVEQALRTRYTIDTVRGLMRRCPGVRFVWVMGVDNFLDFHHWRAWRALLRLLPLAVVDRGGTKLGALAAPAAQAVRGARLPERAARLLPGAKPPAWVFLHGLKSGVSSTTLRAKTRAAGG